MLFLNKLKHVGHEVSPLPPAFFLFATHTHTHISEQNFIVCISVLFMGNIFKNMRIHSFFFLPTFMLHVAVRCACCTVMNRHLKSKQLFSAECHDVFRSGFGRHGVTTDRRMCFFFAVLASVEPPYLVICGFQLRQLWPNVVTVSIMCPQI